MSRRRCPVRGCVNWSAPGETYCPSHRGAGAPRYAERVESEAAERRADAAEEFRRRGAQGQYRGLFGDELNRLMREAAEQKGVADELAACRVVMARLLAEVDDPIELSKALARIAGVSVQAARTQRLIEGEAASQLTDAITAILVELEAGG